MQRIIKIFLNDKFILLLILLNSVIIFIEGFKEIEFKIIQITDVSITILFIIEAIIKISTLGRRNYFKSNWNKMDFGLVMISIPSLILYFFPIDYTDLSFLLILRGSRVFKFFRFFKFIPGINNLLKGIQRALKDSILVLMGFIVFNFVIGILSNHLFEDIAPEHFGNPLLSLYSIFKIFTIEGWYEIPEAIAKQTNVMLGIFTKIYFIIILVVGGIIGLSLVNSIFVDAMVSDNNDEVKAQIKELHRKIDSLLKNNEKNNE